MLWSITLEHVALVAFWAVLAGFFFELGRRLLSLIPGGHRP